MRHLDAQEIVVVRYPIPQSSHPLQLLSDPQSPSICCLRRRECAMDAFSPEPCLSMTPAGNGVDQLYP